MAAVATDNACGSTSRTPADDSMGKTNITPTPVSAAPTNHSLQKFGVASVRHTYNPMPRPRMSEPGTANARSPYFEPTRQERDKRRHYGTRDHRKPGFARAVAPDLGEEEH